ncbi:unnamed protein product [Paramecium primaurelia]|uniref:guanylate cyclase n=1 Tax=Paramecium primaurelia TaxID=5886 RepID=A0A8S1MI22_PARPR|nr:unnamed protein product [Paramecium primaurelia]
MQKVALALYEYINKKYVTKMIRRSEELYSRQIEFEMGESVNLKGIASAELHNGIHSYLSYSQILGEYANRPGNWIFIIINIVCLSIIDLKGEDFSLFYQFVIPLLVGIAMYLIKMLYYSMIKHQQDKQINKRKVTIFKRLKRINSTNKTQIHEDIKHHNNNDIILFSAPRKQDIYKPMIISSFREEKKVQSTPRPEQKVQIFETVCWDEVEVGDIVVLQRNELCPADLLILESNSDHFNVDVANFTGNTNQIYKQPNILTSMSRMHQFKNNSFEYRLLLSGKVNYDRNINDKSLYSGFVRLKNDPQAIDIKKENIIFREQLLLNCDYIYGLVLYAGLSCRYYYNQPKTRVNHSFFYTKVDRFFQFTLILLIVLSFASWMTESLRFMSYGRQWTLQTLCKYLLGYLNMIPYYLHFMFDFMTLCTMIFKQYQFQKQVIQPTTKTTNNTTLQLSSNYQRINDSPLADLSLIDSVIFDKTGTMTIPSFKLKMINFNDQLFSIKNKTFDDLYEWKNYQQQQQDNQEIQQFLMKESQSNQKEASQVRISPKPKQMKRASKHPSIRPVQQEELQIPSNQENCDTNNNDQANFDPEEIIDDNFKLRDIHRSKQPKMFQDSWGSNTDINNNGQGSGVQQYLQQQQQNSNININSIQQQSSNNNINNQQQLLNNQQQSLNSNQQQYSPKEMKKSTLISGITIRAKHSIKIDRSDKQKRFGAERSMNFTKYMSEEGLNKNNDDLRSLDEKDFLNKLITNESRKQTEEAIFILMICHNTQSTYNKSEDTFKHEFSSKIDNLQLEFISHFNYRFVCSAVNKSKYIVEINGRLTEIPVIVTQLEHYKVSVILTKQDYRRFFEDIDQTYDYVQFIRDDSQEMSDQILMNKEEREKWDNMIYKLYMNGCRPVVFFKSFMDTIQYSQFIKNPLQELKTQPRAYELSLVIGIKEKLRKSIITVIKNFLAAEMIIWIASGDSLDKVLPIAYKTEILKDLIPIIHFDQQDASLQIKQQIQWLYNNQIKHLKEDSVLVEKRQSDRIVMSPSQKRKSIHTSGRRQSAKGLLPGFQNSQQRIKPFSILIHGETLDKISQDNSLFNHLCFIIAFSTSVVGYRMTKTQKAILVKILQEKQVWRRRVLVIGDDANDSRLMAYSDFAVQLQSQRLYQQVAVEKMEQLQRTKKDSKSIRLHQITFKPAIKDFKKYQYNNIPYVGTTDIVVKDYPNLISIVLSESRQSAELLENIITFSFYRSYLLCFTLFFQILFQGITYYPPLDYFQSFLYIIPCLLLYIQRMTPKEEKVTNIKNQLVYFFNQNQLDFRQMRYWLFFYKVILYSASEAFIISIMISIMDIRNNNGKIFDEEMKSIQMFVIILLLDLTKQLTHANLYQYIILPISYFAFCTIGYLDYFAYNMFDLFQYIISLESFLFILSLQLLFFCFQKTLTQFHSIYVHNTLYKEEDQMEINNKIKPIQIHNQKRRKDNLVINIQKYILKLFKTEEEIDPIIKQILSGIVLSVKTTKINKITQTFKNIQLEIKYQLNELPSIIEYYRLYYPLSWMLVEGAILVQIWLINRDVDYTWFLYFTFGYNAAQVLMALFIYTVAFQKYHFRISKILITSRLIYKIVYDVYFYQDNDNELTDMLIMQLFMLQPLIDDRPLTIIFYCLTLNISFIIRFSANNTTSDANFNKYIMLNYYLIAMMQTALSSGMHFRIQRNSREEFIQMLTLDQQTNSISDTLSILMPKFIRNIINQKGEFDIQENQGEVAILFCDICQFDKIIKAEKENVIHLLDILFRQYDSLCSQYGLQKIETVGKTYMAAAGLKNIVSQNSANPVLRAIQVAFEMRKFASQQDFSGAGEIIVKIGVHYGNVIAGVIGYHKPQFSLIGDTVNTTSRVCSTGQDGQIKISNDAYKLVSGSQDFVFTKDLVDAKGKGVLVTYILSEQEQRKALRHKKQCVKEGKSKNGQQNSVTASNNQERQGRNQKIKRKPTLVLPHLKQSNPKLQHKSSLNVDAQQQQNSHGDSDHANQIGYKMSVEGANLIEAIEIKLGKENLLVDENFDFPNSEIEKEKLKQLYQSDDEFIETDVLVLDKRKLFLDFDPEVDQCHINDFYKELTKKNTVLVILLKAGVTILLLVQNTSTILIAQIFENQYTWYINLSFGYVIVAIKIIFLVLLIMKQYREKYFKEIYFIYSYIITMIWWIIHIFSYQSFIVGEICIAVGVFLSFMTQLNPIIKMKYKVIESISMITVNLIVVLVKNWEKSLIYYAIILQLIFISNQIYKFNKNVHLYNNKCKLKAKHQQLDSLVKHQLPSHMLEQFLKFQQQRAVLKDSYENVTLLFADIAGFTEYSSKVSPEQVVFMLRNLFTEFDKCCQEKSVYKLYTIGDCYVVMGMLDAKDRNIAQEAKNTVELGFEMISIIKRVRDHINFQGLDMRIGIHTGNIIGGVLGTEIVRYDIYGPDVLIANKMESKGESGKLQVSSTTKEILEQHYPEEFKYVFHTRVDIPSIDTSTDGYFISIRTFDELSMDLQEHHSESCR